MLRASEFYYGFLKPLPPKVRFWILTSLKNLCNILFVFVRFKDFIAEFYNLRKSCSNPFSFLPSLVLVDSSDCMADLSGRYP